MKREKELREARGAISTLQSDVGVLIITDSTESELSDGSDPRDKIVAEVLQQDPTFASHFAFKTNVISTNFNRFQ